ncbi:hypothetical protein CTAM01_05763 [Colletotrichum tamarilloi]|uniref:Uncharacterized protein n=1 Tax=Colletotrichum tamarilloi TaxID=1209934 RepID=A0ABQ9RDG2_9PEZI|nr:uncharacterized protein CTAM01_05763 [Colletotrichum tamarilloi]KAK1501539.1 hypothetical protein CTAM01_05763 [Colletotrichum tamarilloi]
MGKPAEPAAIFATKPVTGRKAEETSEQLWFDLWQKPGDCRKARGPRLFTSEIDKSASFLGLGTRRGDACVRLLLLLCSVSALCCASLSALTSSTLPPSTHLPGTGNPQGLASHISNFRPLLTNRLTRHTNPSLPTFLFQSAFLRFFALRRTRAYISILL